jgi:hypothetical protein
MGDDTIRTLQKILGSIQIVGPAAFMFAGQIFQVQNNIKMGASPAQSQNPLVVEMQQALYAHAYCRHFEGQVWQAIPMLEPAGEMNEILSQANASRERWDREWQIAQVAPTGQVLAQKHRATRLLWPGEFITQDGPGTPPRVGAHIVIYSPRESRTLQPGFYFAFGETVAEPQEVFNAVRFYWSVSATGASELVQTLTRALNRFQTPFRLKCCSHRMLYDRLDAAVLYVNRWHARITAEVAANVYPGLQRYLQRETPLFTRRLAPGLSFAEEPGTGESFGMFRCRVLAEAVWSAYLQGTQDVGVRLQALRQLFTSYGLDFERPYLRTGSVDSYDLPAIPAANGKGR